MFDFNLSALAILAVVPVLGFLIFVHELGHFLAARWMGVRVLEFGFGYPPRLVKLFERNGVEYTLNWIPFGGFVKMAGEDGSEDDPHALPNVAPWRRIIVMAAGPFMNLITAVGIFAFIFMMGVPTVVIVDVNPNSPAAEAGLQSGDVIVAINNNETLYNTARVAEVIREHAGQEIEITVRRGDELVTVTARPRLPEEIPPGQGSLGIQINVLAPQDQIVLKRYGPIEAIIAGFQRTWEVIVLMIAGLTQLIRGLISPNVPAPEGGVGGVVAIGRITAEVARQGWRDLLNLTAFLSINLAILNLLPIPALDGGRILFALAEMISRRRIPPEKEALIHMTGFILLVGLMLIITFMDISNWIAGKPPIPGG